ncbi:uncharacterized protein LOC142339579 [Convolutriloba macropyga]|uniref:uncharacterized protein LOC142339579 n=1 Tax=Convolutriloba macropyga TaxID=536237 RepID=UPI003F52443F
MKHLDWARNKQELGREKNKKGDVVEDEFELKRTAYHEAAHTIVAHYLDVPYRGVTIERRSKTLGHMRYEISEDFMNKDLLESRLAVAVAGKLGEDALSKPSIENSHSTGCLSDYKYARALATRLVTTYGFGSRLYPANGTWEMSEKYKALIDQEVKNLLTSAETKAKTILKEHAEQHVKLSEKLLQNYKLTADEIKQTFKDTTDSGSS